MSQREQRLKRDSYLWEQVRSRFVAGSDSEVMEDLDELITRDVAQRERIAALSVQLDAKERTLSAEQEARQQAQRDLTALRRAARDVCECYINPETPMGRAMNRLRALLPEPGGES